MRRTMQRVQRNLLYSNKWIQKQIETCCFQIQTNLKMASNKTKYRHSDISQCRHSKYRPVEYLKHWKYSHLTSWYRFVTQVIKKAYHKAVLVYHPDKAQHKTADGKKEDRSVFLKVQEAFNVLSNETKRRAYDSQLPFDETTPTEERVAKALEKGPKKFFKLYDPVFKRNARFAVKKPVPEIGGEETPMPEVRMGQLLQVQVGRKWWE